MHLTHIIRIAGRLVQAENHSRELLYLSEETSSPQGRCVDHFFRLPIPSGQREYQQVQLLLISGAAPLAASNIVGTAYTRGAPAVSANATKVYYYL